MTAQRWSPWVWRAGRRSSARFLIGAAARLVGRARPFGSAARVADGLAGADAIAAAHLAARGLLGSAALGRLVRADVLAAASALFDPLAYVRTLGSASTAGIPASVHGTARVVAAVERRGHLVSGRLRELEGAAAALGLALRVPYLDHRLCDWLDAAGGPRGGALLLREVLDGTVPQRLRSRARPTEPPLGAWMLGSLRPLIEAHVLGDDPEGLFLRPGLERLWQGFLHGSVGWRSVWPVAVLRAWLAARRARDHAASRARGRRSRHAA